MKRIFATVIAVAALAGIWTAGAFRALEGSSGTSASMPALLERLIEPTATPEERAKIRFAKVCREAVYDTMKAYACETEAFTRWQLEARFSPKDQHLEDRILRDMFVIGFEGRLELKRDGQYVSGY